MYTVTNRTKDEEEKKKLHI